MSRSLRIAIFTHDTFGLGHIRRSLHFLRGLSKARPDSALLLVTGSPAVGLMGELPPNADSVKIPTVARTGPRELRPPHLQLPEGEVPLLRERLIRETILGFDPDVFLVDNFPLGSRRELLPTLQELRHRRTRVVLGLRDVLDAPEVVRGDWSRQGIYDVLERCYDRILVYGSAEILEVEEAYALPPAVAERVRYCGIVTSDDPPRDRDEIRRELGARGPLVVVHGGGGGDGHPLLEAFLDCHPQLPAATSLVVTGPLMGAAQRLQLLRRAHDVAATNGGARLLLHEYVPDLRSYVAAADVVVSMCGYNSAAEIAACKVAAVVVPRTWQYGEHHRRLEVRPEAEQLVRARALERLGLVDVIEPEALSPDCLAQRIRAALDRGSPAATGSLNLGGTAAVIAELLALVDAEDAHARGACP